MSDSEKVFGTPQGKAKDPTFDDSIGLDDLSTDDLELIHQIADRFEKACRDKESFPIPHEFLGNVSGPARQLLLLELNAIAKHYRERNDDRSITRNTGLPPEIPGFQLMPEIARGGMGIVYPALDLQLNRKVAIKVMLPGMDENAFVRESQITARLAHPGIPPVYGMGHLSDGRPFLSIKLIRGTTLDKVLKTRTDPGIECGKYIAIFEQVCQAVSFAHSQGIIHRDLKPSNIMLGTFGEVQVMDWGLARPMPANPSPTTTRRLTEARGNQPARMSLIKGTPAYMAPEQAAGAAVDARADVFSLGGTLAVILTGKPPFEGSTILDAVRRAKRADLNDVFSRLDACSADPELVAICKKCLAPKAEERFSNGAELVLAVASCRAAVEERLRRQERDKAVEDAREIEESKFRRENEAKVEERRKKLQALRWLVASIVLLGIMAALATAATSLWQTAEANRAEAIAERDAAQAAKLLAQKAQASEAAARQKLAIVQYGNAMQLAHQEFRNSNISATRTILDSADPSFRGWEWHYLDRLCDPAILTLRSSSLPILSAQWSPDALQIVTSGLDKVARIWDVKSSRVLRSLNGHQAVITSARYNSAGNRIVTASGDMTAKIWDAETGIERITLKGHQGIVNHAVYSSDGLRIVTASTDKTAKIWDAETGIERLTLKGHQGIVTHAAYSPDGQRIVTASTDKTAKIWDAMTGEELASLAGHSAGLTTASFSPDGKRIVTASLDHTAKVWDAGNVSERLTLRGHAGGIASARFSPDGAGIVTASADKTAKIWDAVSGVEQLNLQGHASWLTAAEFNSDGSRIVTACGDGSAKIWDAKSNAEVDSIIIDQTRPQPLATTPDGRRIAMAGQSNSVIICDSASGTALLTLPSHQAAIRFVAFSPDGLRIATVIADHSVRIWDAATGTLLQSLTEHQGNAVNLAFSPDGQRIATACTENYGCIWDVKTGRLIHTLTGHRNSVCAVSFSPDGNRIVTASWDNTARVWDAATGRPIIVLEGHFSQVAAAAFSPDGTRIVTASWDKTARIWDAATGVELLVLRGHREALLDASFSANGSQLITRSRDRVVKTWDCRPLPVSQSR